MATPVADSYSGASGATIYGGRSAGLPAWVPAPGHFANISLNTLQDVKPSGWPTGDAGGPFANYAGGAFDPDFSNLGGYVVHGSGHLTQGTPVWGGVWVFDLDSLSWVGRNVPATPLLEEPASSSYYNSYYESLDAATLGHTYVPHTYDGLAIQPAALGGGAKGSLLRVSYAGSSNVNSAIHRFDLSSLSNPPTRVLDNWDMPSSYPATAADTTRNGLWMLGGNGHGPLKFFEFDTGNVMAYPGVEFNENGNASLIYLPPPYDCIFSIAFSNDPGGVSYWCSRIVNDVPQAFVKLTVSGVPVGDQRSGGQWSTLLNCIVSYEAAGSASVHKLTPPAPANLTVDAWVWTNETLTGDGGAVPCRSTTNDNGAWGRFIEVPKAKCFVWCDSVSGPVQAWRLAGM
jgi:hypothetical protein